MSPYLFTLVMELLNIIMQSKIELKKGLSITLDAKN